MCFLKTFLCNAIIIVYLNLHYSSVILRNLTSEGGVESNPGPRPFAIRKVAQASHHQGDIRYRATLLESNAWPMHILPLFSHQLKELVFGNLQILIMYWNRGIKFSKRCMKIKTV